MIEKFNGIFYLIVFIIHFLGFGVYAYKMIIDNKKFKLAFFFITLHNLNNENLERALLEITRVSDCQYICVESYRNEIEKANLLYWQVTCECFFTPDEWKWFFDKSGYNGDYSFIYFE